MARFTDTEMRQRFEAGKLRYKGFTIEAKRDYADVLAYEQGFYIRDGFVVVSGTLTNAIPGAGWFQTVDQAKEGVDILLAVGEENFHEFYRRLREAKAAAFDSVVSSFQADAAADADAAEEPSGPKP